MLCESRRWPLLPLGKNINESEELPPTSDTLGHHIRRENYQTYLWKQALVPMQTLPSPDENGWKLEEDRLVLVLMSKDSGPNSIIELTTSHCQQSACAWNCFCEVNNLFFTEACIGHTCMADVDFQNARKKQATSISKDPIEANRTEREREQFVKKQKKNYFNFHKKLKL